MLSYPINLDDYKTDEKRISLEACPKSHKVFSTLFLAHYPGSKGIMGRSLNYLIRLEGVVSGIIGFNSPPLNYKKFRAFFGTTNEKEFVNNNVFRLICHEKNLATRVLKMAKRRVALDYEAKFGETLLGFITFVEPPRTGGIYKGDNWTSLGETEGKCCKKRDMTAWTNKEWGTGTKKLIFATKHT